MAGSRCWRSKRETGERASEGQRIARGWNVTIDELERCISILLALARSRGVEKLDTGSLDLYWTVPSPEWIEMQQQPDLGVGSLGDDLTQLEKLLVDPQRASSVDLDRAAAMLRLISDRLSN